MAKYTVYENGTVKVNNTEPEKKKKQAKYTVYDDGRVTVNTAAQKETASTAQSAFSDPKFDQKAQAGLAAYNQKKETERKAQSEKSVFQKWLEINTNAYLAQSDNPLVQSVNTLTQQYRQDTSYKEPNDKWSEDQKKQFGYLYQQNPTSAAQYAESVNNEINKAAAELEKKKVMQKAANRGVVANTALALMQGVTASADLLDNMAEFAGRGTITQKSGLTLYDRSQANVEGYSQKLNKLGTINEDVPVLGGKGIGDLYSLGYSAAQSILYGATGNGALTMIQFFSQAAASGIDEKMDQGATAKQAMLYGMASGAAEAVAEKIGIDNLFKNSGAKTLRSALGNMLKQSAAEGMEEAITSVLNTFSDQVIMGKESQYKRAIAEYSKTMSQEEAKKKALDDILQEITYDALGGMITGAGNTAVMTGAKAASNVSQGKGALSGLTANEQKVVDKVFKDALAEEAKKSKDGKVSGAKKTALFEETIKAMDEGSISIETIEEVLGGDNYKAYRDSISKEEALQKEYDGLNAMKLGELTGVQTDRKAELRKQLDEIKNSNTREAMKTKLSEDVEKLAKTGRLAESYREKERRYQAFQADVSQYDEKSRSIVQNAIDSGILNNTRRSHQLVDLVAKIGGDKAMRFDFANNEKLKESGFALDGKTVNSVLTKDGVTININSAKALNSVVGHEITHALEGTEFYSALESAATELAKAKGEYDSRLKAIEAMYSENLEGYGGDGRKAALEKELVADLVGDYLFTDTEFIKRLSTGDRNTFEKIFDEIKYLCRVATAGSKEAKQLEKVKKAFEDAYRQDAKNTAEDGGVRYSLSKNAKSELHKALYDKTYKGEVLLRDVTPGIMLSHDGVKNLPMTMNASHIRENVFTEEEAGKLGLKVDKHTHYHGQGEDFFLKVIDGLDNVKEAYRGTKNADEPSRRENYFLLVSEFLDQNGNTVNVPVYVNEHGQVNRAFIDVNKISTVFGRDNFRDYINRQIQQKNLVRIKNRSTQSSESNALIAKDYRQDASSDSIRENAVDVNQKLSLSSQKDRFPVRKDLDAVRGKIYGSDVVFPVRQDLKAMRKNSHSSQEDLFPVRKDLDAVRGNSYSSLEDKFPVRKDLKPGRSEVNANGVAMRELGPVRKDISSVATRYTDTQKNLAPVRDDLKSPTQAEKPIERQRKWVKTATESEALGRPIFAADLDQNKITYLAVSNKETLGKANAKLDTMGYDTAIQYFNNQIYNDRVSLDDIAIGERLIQEAIMRGDTGIAGELIQNIAILGTELGQKVQALSLIQKMTPEGQLGMLKKIVDRGKLKGDITFDGVEITQDMIDHILDAYSKDGSYDQDALNKAVEDVKQKIAEQMGVSVTEKVNAWRYLSMLGNPKTHIRNLVSNLAMAGTTAVKDAVARTVETFSPISDRTKTWKQASKDVKDFAKQTTVEMKNEISGEGKYSNTADLKSRRKIFKNEILQKIRF